MRFLGHLGGGLGDIFIHLYHHSQYQILPMIKNITVDLVVECCNPAVKSMLSSLVNEQGRPVFRDMIYRDLFFSETEESGPLFEAYRDQGYYFINEEAGWSALFAASGIENPGEYGYFHRKLYRHRYAVTYQEREFLEELESTPYIVIHPSGGLQSVDGLSRDEYAELIKALVSELPYRIVTVGASHRRVWADPSKECELTEEKPFNIRHENFLDLTDKTSGALCANIVEGATAFVGTHSAWLNMFWNFDKPAICILSNDTDWGTADQYIETNGCNWGFKLPHSAVIPCVKSLDAIIHDVLGILKEALCLSKQEILTG